jgi:hypothetical protein
VRLPQLWAPLWNDESFVWVVSGRPAAQWWAALVGDVHPPLWYGIEWLVSQISRSPLALRLFPFICGLAVVWLGSRVSRACGAPLAAQVLTALCLALMPQQIYYSAEVRMYSALAALYLAGVWCVLSRRWGWMALCMTAMLYTHHYGFIYAATLGALALWQYRKEWPDVVFHGGLALIAYMPLAPMTRIQLENTGSYWAGLGWDGVVLTPALWLAGAPLAKPALGGALIVAALALIMAAVWRGILRRHYALLWLVFGPMLIALAISPFKNVWLTRAFIGCGAMSAVLMSIEFNARWAAGLILPILLVGTLTDQTRPSVNDRYATSTVADYLREHLRPGDAVLCLGSAAWMELQPYRLPATVSLSESGDWLSTGGLSDETREALGVPPITGEVRRVWIFAAQLPGGAYIPDIPAGARLVASYSGTEKVFSSALYVLEDLYGYAGK